MPSQIKRMKKENKARDFNLIVDRIGPGVLCTIDSSPHISASIIKRR